MTKLAPAQLAALNEVAQAAKYYRSARVNLEAELRLRLRLELEAQLSTLRDRRDRAAFRAKQLKVPQSRIGVEGMGTKNPKSVTDAIEAGRKAVGGTLDDPTAAPALIAAATVEEPLYFHPLDKDKTGKPVCSNHPFALGDEPGTFTFTAGLTLHESTDERITRTFRMREDGTIQPVDDDSSEPITVLLLGPTPVGAQLRAAALAFLANAAN